MLEKIQKILQQGGKIEVIAKWSKNWTNPLDKKHKEKYFVDFSFKVDNEEYYLPNMPLTKQEEELKKFGVRDYIKQFGIAGNNLSEIRKEIRDNWDRKYFKLNQESLNLKEYQII